MRTHCVDSNKEIISFGGRHRRSSQFTDTTTINTPIENIDVDTVIQTFKGQYSQANLFRSIRNGQTKKNVNKIKVEVYWFFLLIPFFDASADVLWKMRKNVMMILIAQRLVDRVPFQIDLT